MECRIPDQSHHLVYAINPNPDQPNLYFKNHPIVHTASLPWLSIALFWDTPSISYVSTLLPHCYPDYADYVCYGSQSPLSLPLNSSLLSISLLM